MFNNIILRSIRDTFNFSNEKMFTIFDSTDFEVTEEQVVDWIKKEHEHGFKKCNDTELAVFLNGFINDQRGKKEGPAPVPESKLTYNIILKKLIIALNLKSEDTIEIMELGGSEVKKYELSAFLRRPDHKQYRECREKVLKNFIKGIQLKYNEDLQTTTNKKK